MTDDRNSDASRVESSRIVPPWLVILGTLVVLAFTGVLMARVFFPDFFVQLGLAPQPNDDATPNSSAQDPNAIPTADVIELTAVRTVEGSGPLAPLQLADVFWDTTGRVGTVHVKPGDEVVKDQILMTVEIETAPTSILLAQVDLVNARNNLEDLLKPSELQIATAEQNVLLARETVDDAVDDLRDALNPAGESLYDAVADAELALFQAEADAQLGTVNSDVQALSQADAEVSRTLNNLQRLQAIYDEGNRSDAIVDQIEAAQGAYNAAVNARNELLLRIERTGRTADSSVEDAREELEDAVTDLNAALEGPDSFNVEKARAALRVAEAQLADAEETLNELLYGADTDTIAGLQAQVLQAELTLQRLVITAPFDGTVLEVNYRQGDIISTTLPAVIIANQKALNVTLSVDEGDVATIEVGQPVTLEFDSFQDTTLDGVVSKIASQGQNVQGIVRYDVELTLLDTLPGLRLGMTADAVIITNVSAGTLAVPLDAVQFDETGEYVMVLDGGTGEEKRVDVVSGEIQGDYVVVISDELSVGMQVELIDVQPASSVNFGPPGN